MISAIHFDGTGSKEPDEYVVIKNASSVAVALTGWRLLDVSDNRPSFTFTGGTLLPGEEVRVYTNEIHPESGGYSFAYGNAIWNNCQPDTAGLFDPTGKLASTLSYVRAPGC